MLNASSRAILGRCRNACLTLPPLPYWRRPRPTHRALSRFLVSTAPGGLLDILSRILGQKITETTGQAVVIENKTGGNGAVAGGDTAKAPPDGYTLLMGFHGVNAMLPHMTSKLTFDPTRKLLRSFTS